MIYLIGSLRNPRVQMVGEQLRAAGWNVFDDWFAAGPEADDAWQRYEQAKGHDFVQALEGAAAEHVFHFDYEHLYTADAAVLVLPAGKSAHLELGWALGRSIPGFVLLDGEPERFDVMYKFADGVARNVGELIQMLKERLMGEHGRAA